MLWPRQMVKKVLKRSRVTYYDGNQINYVNNNDNNNRILRNMRDFKYAGHRIIVLRTSSRNTLVSKRSVRLLKRFTSVRKHFLN